jgi:hypothetical protein
MAYRGKYPTYSKVASRQEMNFKRKSLTEKIETV